MLKTGKDEPNGSIRSFENEQNLSLQEANIALYFTERSPMNIYVGNLSFKTTEKGLKEKFETFGIVKSAKIMTDGYTGKSKGFGFVEMPNMAEGKAAIVGMNGKEFDRSPLKVNEAKPRDVPSNRTRVH